MDGIAQRRGSRAFVRAGAGAVIWILWAGVVRPGLAPTLLMLSPFVLVPLALGVFDDTTNGPHDPLIGVVGRWWLGPAIIAALAWVSDPGTTAAVLTLPWWS